ncbi:discoidin domain-containing protein [Streptomyces sp. CBMA152]|uniref:discoidin domain-containing protein n=1 Tax=Streptomyces sp. CBMA152 TaxID=1896312 RepID=UPI0016615933|nr:discoidin domain-containing protein [Streptomyces sp. CBMA152]MBD0741169.1 hypothetical protein [Streptomyces sp. CBMA152]
MSATLSCPDCGTPARPMGQSFCDTCGAFLKWETSATPPAPAGSATPDTSPAAETPAPASAAEPPATPAPARRPAPASTSTAASAPATAHDKTAPPQNAEPETAPLPAVAAQPDRPAREETTAPLPAVRERESETAAARERDSEAAATRTRESEAARALLVPVPEPTAPTPPQEPGTVLPARPEAARPRVRAAQPAPEPEDGTPCRGCGAPNRPHRHFCRSCANPLDPRPADTASGPYAGQRPALHRDRTRWVARALLIAGAVTLVVGGVLGGPPAARAVQDHFSKRVAVHPTAWQASHSAAGHGPELAFDSYSNTWWGSGYGGDSAGQYLEATFGQPTDLLALIVTPGTSKRSGQQAEQARPQEFDLLVTDSGGKTHTSHHVIDDGGVQRVDVRVRDAVTARLVLRSAYGATKDKQVAIAELEFFSRAK